MSRTVKKKKYEQLTEPIKTIRDHVHEHITLSALEVKLVDTAGFQRLKDIRQLTCQQVYPAARHTRFEHSLGVLELTKRAIKRLEINGIIEGKTKLKFEDTEKLSTQIAALLHDIGHSPFSHMGESEIKTEHAYDCLQSALRKSGIEQFNEGGSFYKIIDDEFKNNKGATHEILTCSIILNKYRPVLLRELEGCDVEVDYELVIRSIMALKYEEVDDNFRRKNLLIELISSNMLDMDKLDYILRDAFFTGIDVPLVDTKRLFRNMYVSRKYKMVFMSRAVPILQNLIEARDQLYLWVYNHHTVVYSDFIYMYIFRRLTHNFRDELRENGEDINNWEQKEGQMELGALPKGNLFSANAIVHTGVSDSDFIHIINWQHSEYLQNPNLNGICENNEKARKRRLRALELIKAVKERNYLKSWWKRPFELKFYFEEKFSKDDYTQQEFPKRVCTSVCKNFDPIEFRTQIAKHVLYIVNLPKSLKHSGREKIEILKDGDFFIVHRFNKFFGTEDIQKLQIYIKHNEVAPTHHIDSEDDDIKQGKVYYHKSLDKLLPQKKYDEMYDKPTFFMYLKRYDDSLDNYGISKEEYYKLIDDVFVHVATEFTEMAPSDFVALYCAKYEGEEKVKKEVAQKTKMYEMADQYINKNSNKKGGAEHKEQINLSETNWG